MLFLILIIILAISKVLILIIFLLLTLTVLVVSILVQGLFKSLPPLGWYGETDYHRNTEYARQRPLYFYTVIHSTLCIFFWNGDRRIWTWWFLLKRRLSAGTFGTVPRTAGWRRAMRFSVNRKEDTKPSSATGIMLDRVPDDPL